MEGEHDASITIAEGQPQNVEPRNFPSSQGDASVQVLAAMRAQNENGVPKKKSNYDAQSTATAWTSGLRTKNFSAYQNELFDDGRSLAQETKMKHVEMPPGVDLPSSVLTSTSQITDQELLCSVFGGFSVTSLEKARIIDKQFTSNFEEIRKQFLNGIAFKKVDRSRSRILPRVISMNRCFTVFFITEGRWRSKSTLDAGDVFKIIKGKGSDELKKCTSPEVNHDNTLVMKTSERTYSMVWASKEQRDKIAVCLKLLLGIKNENFIEYMNQKMDVPEQITEEQYVSYNQV